VGVILEQLLLTRYTSLKKETSCQLLLTRS